MPLFGPPNVVKLKKKGDVRKLIKALGYRDACVRKSAAEALGGIGDASAVEPLLAVLKDENEDASVRTAGAGALGNIGDVQAVGLLLAVLKDENEDDSVRRSAAFALGDIDDASVLEPLLALLRDEDENTRVRKWAAHPLGKTGDTRAVEPLLVTLTDEDKALRGWSAEALGRIGDARAVESLCTALMDEEDYVRLRSAEALGRIGDARAVDPLCRALGDEDKYVQQRAVWALKQLGWKPGDIELAIEALKRNSRAQQVGKGMPRLVAGNVLAMAIVHEGHVIEPPDLVEIANELLTGFSEAGILTGVTLHPHSGITIRRADESAWYRGDYEPGDELPQMLNEGIALLRDRLLAAGQTMEQVNARTVTLKGRSRVVSTCWVGMHILQ